MMNKTRFVMLNESKAQELAQIAKETGALVFARLDRKGRSRWRLIRRAVSRERRFANDQSSMAWLDEPRKRRRL